MLAIVHLRLDWFIRFLLGCRGLLFVANWIVSVVGSDAFGKLTVVSGNVSGGVSGVVSGEAHGVE